MSDPESAKDTFKEDDKIASTSSQPSNSPEHREAGEAQQKKKGGHSSYMNWSKFPFFKVIIPPTGKLSFCAFVCAFLKLRR